MKVGATIGAKSPWRGEPAKKPGRPRNTPAAQITPAPGCIWPKWEDGVCGSGRKEGFTVCEKHARIVDGLPQSRCVWPGCPQGTFGAVCTYHAKLAHGLLSPGRK